MKCDTLSKTSIKIFALLLLTAFSTAYGQVTLYSETFPINGKGVDGVTTDMTGITNWTIAYTGNWSPMASGEYFKVVNGAFESFNTDAEGPSTESNMTSSCVWSSLSVDISCYSNVTFKVDLGRAYSNSGSGCKAYYTLNGGATWVEFGSVVNTTGAPDGGYTTYTASGLIGTTAQIKVAHWGTTSTPFYRHDNVSIVGTYIPATPAANLVLSNYTGTSVDLNWTNGSGNSVLVLAKPISATLVDPISGINYIANSVYGLGTQIGTGNYAVYNGNGASASITELTNGVNYEFAVYTYNSGIPCYNLNELLGSTLCTPPTTQASEANITAITASGMNLAWTKGNGNRTLVVARENSATQMEPFSGNSYSSSSTFGVGSQIGTGNYVVYDSAGSSVAISGLAPNTNYIYSIYTYDSLTKCYNLSELTANSTTLNTPNYEIDAFNGATIVTCSGFFEDSGGETGSYGNNENYSMTFCSESGQYLTFDFSNNNFDIDVPGDTLFFYDGLTATGTPIAFLTYLDDKTQTTYSSQLKVNTLSTCVTVKWKSDESGVDVGWKAQIGCQNPPSCSSNLPASDLFSQAPLICSFNNYCGSTSLYYGEDAPYNLIGGGYCPTPKDGLFGGTIENNSWLKFIANSTSASFDFNASACETGIEVGVFEFNGGVFALKSPCSTTDGGHFGNFTVTASGLTVGNTYYIMIDGYSGANCSYSINANLGAPSVNAGVDQTLCATNTTLAATSAIPGVWTVVSGTGTFANSTNPTTAVSGLSVGANTFVWTSNTGCNNVSDTVVVTVNTCSCPTPIISYASSVFCKTLTTEEPATLSGAGSYSVGTYTTSPAGLTINASTGAIAPSTSVAGSYLITFTLPAVGTCSTITATAEVIIVSPTATAASNRPICVNQEIELTASGGTSYSWSGPNNFSSTDQNPRIQAAPITASGTYTVTITGTGGCTSTAQTTISLNSLPEITISGPTQICKGSSTTLTAISNGTYLWNNNETTSSINISPIATSRYWVSVTSSMGCKNEDNYVVTVTDLPTANAESNSPICIGATLNLTSSGGTDYLWSGPSGYYSTTQSNSVQNATTYNSGVYTVVVSDANGCSSTAQTLVQTNTAPVIKTNNNLVCVGDTVKLISNGGISYRWTGPNDYRSSDSISLISNAANRLNGNYTVIVTNNNGCTSSAISTVKVFDNPIIHVEEDLSVCYGLSVSLTATGGETYLWSNGVTNSSITVTPYSTASYRVIGKNVAGCKSADTITVTVYPVINAYTLITGPTNCVKGGTLKLNSSEIGISYQLLVNGSPFGNSHAGTGVELDFGTVNVPGVYTIRATRSSDGCERMMNGFYTVN